MANARKGNGNGTAGRRRTKSAVKKAAAIIQELNGTSAHGAGSYDAASEASTTETNIETIRLRAYELFIARGATHGDDLADWLRAEQELLGARKP